MRRWTALALSLLVLLAWHAPSARGGAGLQAAPIATGLAFPAGFTFAPDGRIFYGERLSGEIRILSADGTTDSLFFDIPDFVHDQAQGVQGLLGIALHPNYPATSQVFAYVSRMRDGRPRNQIIRLTDTGGVGGDIEVIFESRSRAGHQHNGGRIVFGPDGLLYAWVGDARLEPGAQRIGRDNGKIHRMDPDGSVPATNPFPGRTVFSYGHRNGLGIAFDPGTGRAWQSENGPECTDEINRLRKGRNFGWGRRADCDDGRPPRSTNQDGSRIVLPVLIHRNPVAVTGIAFCDGCGLGSAYEGHLLYGAFNNGAIYDVTLNDARKKAVSRGIALTHSDGILALETAPDGSLAFSDPDGIYRLAAA